MFFPKILRENRHRDFKSFIFPQRKLKKCKAPMSKLLSVHLYIIIWQITVMTKLKSLTTETIFSDFGWDKRVP